MSDLYQIGSGLTENELQAANWWVRHKTHLHRLGYSLLIAVIVLFWGYIIWSLLDAYIISYPREHQIPTIIANNQRLQAHLTAEPPQAIQISPIARFMTTERRQDFLTHIANPNPSWWAEFRYHFAVGDATTTERDGYILPNGERYLTEIGWKNEANEASPELHISDLRWHRIDPQTVERDYAEFAAKRLQFQIAEPTYVNDLKIGDQTVGQTTFTVRNGSGFGYWSVDFTIVLFRNGEPVGVTTLNQTDLKPGEARPITLNWFDNLTGISNTIVQPNVNILDSSVFLPPERF